MTRSGAALASSSMITAALGFFFWLLAARTIEPDELGVASAIVATTVMLANLATLGLRNALIRFLPVAGRDSRRLVRFVAMLTVGVSVVLATGFALTAGWWSDELGVLSDRPLAGLLFVAGCAAWTSFVLQDSMLIGLDRAVLVPSANAAYAAIRLGVLVAVAAWGTWAVPIAWCVPALLIATPVSVVIGRTARRAVRHTAVDELIGRERPVEATPRAIAAFAGADFVADSVRFLSLDILVLVILAARDAETTAFFYMAMTIASTGQFIAAGMTAAFVATASARPEHAAALARRTVRNIAIVLLPAIGVGLVMAPIVLSWFGPEYRDAATGLLRLLLIDLVPLTALTVALGWARYERQLARIAGVATLIALGPLLGVLTLGPGRSLAWIGWVAIVVHTIAALGIAWRVRRPVVGRPTLARKAVEMRAAIRHRRRVRAVATVLDEFDAALPAPSVSPVRRRIVQTEADVAVVIESDAHAADTRAELADSGPQGRVLKVALSPAGRRGLESHRAALIALADECSSSADADAADRAMRIVPTVLDHAEVAATYVSAESAISGYTAVDRIDLLPAVAAAVGSVHAATARHDAVLDDDFLMTLVRQPISSLAEDRRLWPWLAELHALESQLVHGLRGRTVRTSRLHGDCWLGNVLVTDVSGVTEVVGLIDWENSVADGIPDIDMAHLWLSAQVGELGAEAAAWLSTPPQQRVDWRRELRLPNDASLPPALALSLGWLHHVANGLERAERFGLSRRWIDRNVVPVLSVLTATPVLAQKASINSENRYLRVPILDTSSPPGAN